MFVEPRSHLDIAVESCRQPIRQGLPVTCFASIGGEGLRQTPLCIRVEVQEERNIVTEGRLRLIAVIVELDNERSSFIGHIRP